MEQGFNIDEFLAGIERDRSKSSDFDPSKSLNLVMMSSQDNQGIITFVPFMSKEYNNFYLKVPGVLEFYADTTLVNSGEGWYRLLPIEAYGQLTDTEMELYNQIKTLYNNVYEYELPFTEMRIRTYSLFTGVQLSHVNATDKSKRDELNDCACLYVFPSNRVIDAFHTAVNSKIDLMKGSRTWLPAILSTSNTGRQGVVQISFTKSASAGYDASVAFEFNSALQPVVDPERVFEDELIAQFDSVWKTFSGWRYDKQNDKMFNLTYMQEFRDNLRKRLDQLNKESQVLPPPADAGVQYQNNNVADPNRPAETPAPEAPTAEPVKKTPF